MGEKKTTPITIDDVQYVLEDMKPEQQTQLAKSTKTPSA